MKKFGLLIAILSSIAMNAQAEEQPDTYEFDGEAAYSAITCDADQSKGIHYHAETDYVSNDITLKPFNQDYQQLSEERIHLNRAAESDSNQPSPLLREQFTIYLQEGQIFNDIDLSEEDKQRAKSLYQFVTEHLKEAQKNGHCLQYSEDGSANANGQTKNASKSGGIILDNLDFKTVMKGIYGDQARGLLGIDGSEFKGMPYMALGNIVDNSGIVAVMHPVKMYQNEYGAARYLVMIEKKKLLDNQIEVCHGCQVDIQLFTFAKVDHQYQLIDHSPDIQGLGSYGQSDIDLAKLDFQRLDDESVGALFKTEYAGQGVSLAQWNILRISDKGEIQILNIADAAADNSGNYDEGDPNYYSYDSDVSIKPNGDVVVSYQGQRYDENSNQVISVDGLSKTYQYQPSQQQYIEIP